ncbi:hypothetical protein ACVFI8_03150 [Agarivorans sp. MS3-6]
MNLILKILLAVGVVMAISGCEPEGGIDLTKKCAPNCMKSGGNNGGKTPVSPNPEITITSGIYRDSANDHVATIDKNGRVLFWDDYTTDRELEQRGLVQTQVRLNSQYREENACTIAYNGARFQHNYSFEKTGSSLLFFTSCGDARAYQKSLNPTPARTTIASKNSISYLYTAAGESLELSADALTNIDQQQAILNDNGLLSLPAPYQHCTQEYFLDEQSVVILSSPNCESTGFESGLYSR